MWFFFENLFVKSVLQLVNGEAEVWMVETGMNQRIWIWKVPDHDDEEEDDDETEGGEGALP